MRACVHAKGLILFLVDNSLRKCYYAAFNCNFIGSGQHCHEEMIFGHFNVGNVSSNDWC